MAEDVGSRFIPEGPIVIVQEKNGREERHSVNQNKHRGSKLTPARTRWSF
jgi:C-terminal processing protease CtpA/Prc